MFSSKLTTSHYRTITAACAVALALLATGCAGDDRPATGQEGSAAPSQSSTSGLATPDDVKNRLTEAGLTCDGDEIADYENSQSLECTKDVLISVYSSKDQARIATDFHMTEGKSVITDENWILLADSTKLLRPYAKKLDLEIHKD